ncbi:hypothetical protein ABZ330_32295 [Streptomyces sp. NPDC006172]|uniref:hypothetical protein n=1 Tax=Streptomyces sp. NPDC006172 TaxID=3154470 RepID=UPI00340A90A7
MTLVSICSRQRWQAEQLAAALAVGAAAGPITALSMLREMETTLKSNFDGIINRVACRTGRWCGAG